MKNLFLRFSKREKGLFVVTVSVIAAIIIYAFIAEPLYKKWGRLDLNLESAKTRLFKNLKLLSEKEYLEKEYEKYKAYAAKETGGEEEVASVLKEIEATALSCGVKITSIKPKGVKKLKTYSKISIEVLSEAKISQFLKFIYELEGSKKLLKVEKLILTLKTGQSDVLAGTFLIYKVSF